MNKKSLNTNNVEIPPVVQNKINLAILQIKSEEENNMKNISIKKPIKMLIAASVCAAVFICSIFATNIFNNNKISTNPVGATDTSSNSSWNPFVIKVMAAELEPDTILPISIAGEPAPYLLMADENPEGNISISYGIALPISCQGENIESLTYSVNKGDFQVNDASSDNNIDNIIDANNIENSTDDVIDITIVEFTDPNASGNVAYSKSLNVTYDEQKDDFLLTLHNTVPNLQEAYDLIWNSEATEYGSLAEKEATALSLLLDGVEITVTANYNDGTTATRTIGLEAKAVAIEPTELEDGSVINEVPQLFVKEV